MNNKKHSWHIYRLIILLLLPIGASMGVGITVTMFVYPGEANPTFTYFMTHPWPGLVFAAAVEAVLAIILYRIFSRTVFEQSPKTQPVKYQFRELLLGVAIGGVAITLATLVLAIFGIYRPVGFGSIKGILVGLAAGLGAGVAEELLFRGVVLRLFFPLIMQDGFYTGNVINLRFQQRKSNV